MVFTLSQSACIKLKLYPLLMCHEALPWWLCMLLSEFCRQGEQPGRLQLCYIHHAPHGHWSCWSCSRPWRRRCTGTRGPHRGRLAQQEHKLELGHTQELLGQQYRRKPRQWQGGPENNLIKIKPMKNETRKSFPNLIQFSSCFFFLRW